MLYSSACLHIFSLLEMIVSVVTLWLLVEAADRRKYTCGVGVATFFVIYIYYY